MKSQIKSVAYRQSLNKNFNGNANRRFGRFVFAFAVALAIPSVSSLWAQTVTVSLSSPQHGMILTPGDTVDWTIVASVSVGDNEGLAFICADLLQSESNPEHFDIPHANEIPVTMTKFASPLGVCNPPDQGATTGYVGTQVGTPGSKNLIQIGGGQTLFGFALPVEVGFGQTAYTAGGIGQSGDIVITSGSFVAPSVSGEYVFELQNVLANVLTNANQPPNFSTAQGASINLVDQSITIGVGENACDPNDTNCDGLVNGIDIQGFLSALLEPSAISCSNCVGDSNQNGVVEVSDIQNFVEVLIGV